MGKYVFSFRVPADGAPRVDLAAVWPSRFGAVPADAVMEAAGS